ncbi:hypothetical protein A1O3_02620 [Capronia epimyces CBS 606.96]|uniref:Uncharacterized protein n=1 Tax=Capronia epimyces CBS 606.96 TaxID=1182542 RepID=W9YAK7_9EURO|nr:uncharacterized protein A1O3_02620 [Capronia epimyces CBS 606.96]EXJ89553.1 hypothetical protein A1O3_02620 [Capronia epimyces CBS 606.96]
MPRIDCTNIQRWAPVRKDHDLDVGSFKVDDLRIEPSKIPLMRQVMLTDIPVTSLEKVVEPHADSHLIFDRDGRKEATTQDSDVRAWQPEGRTVEQDKLSQRFVLVNVLFESAKNIEGIRPVRVIRFMITGDEEHSAELMELEGQKGKIVVLVDRNVSHIAKQRQVGRLWDDLEDIVAFWSLQMEIGENPDRHSEGGW